MFRWVRKLSPVLLSQSDEAPGIQTSGVSQTREADSLGGSPPGSPVLIPAWVKVLPFFLSAFLYLSGLFSLISPLPILYLAVRAGRKWAWLAALSNGALVVLGLGWTWPAGMYLILILVLSLSMAEFLRTRRTIEKTAGITLLTVMLSGLILISIVAHHKHVSPVSEVRNQISDVVDVLKKSMPSDSHTSLVGESDPEAAKQTLFLESPSVLAIFSLILVWLNLTALFRLNPNGIRQRQGLDPGFFKTWKVPEVLLWPTIAAGFTLIFDFGSVSVVGMNLFRFLMAIYALQGLSILSFVFDVLKYRGFIRSVCFVAAVFLMLPLLLSLGFFDQWFDFRSKLRQS